jgi:hypothetical protein
MLACTLNKTASTASLVLAWTATGYTAEDHRPNYMQESAAPWMDQQDSRDDTPLWEVTFFHFHSTLNKLDGLYSDDLQFASQNGIGLNLGRVLFRDPFRCPWISRHRQKSSGIMKEANRIIFFITPCP